MATLVTFHAHPDDESIACGGVMRAAADAGHRVVLVVATRGEHGEVVPGVLDEGELLGDRRVIETRRAADVLGVARVEFLGYVDSGMVDTATNGAPGSFWGADVDAAAERLAAILREEDAEVLTVYDDHGGYGHPDHIQVHRVGRRAGELAATPRVYEATMNRDEMRVMMAAMPDADEGPDAETMETIGSPAALLTTRVDVRPWLAAKREAMRAHRSQIAEDSFFLAMPDETFAQAFGTEWFIRVGVEPGDLEDDLFGGDVVTPEAGESTDGWRGTVALPGRTVVRGRGVQNPLPGGREPDFGLYLGVDYHPRWAHERLDWPDFGLPRDPVAAAAAIEEMYGRARDGECVEAACRAGKGRTGTVIACLAILDGLRPDHAVSWTRHHFHHRAVQTPWQRRWVVRFGDLAGTQVRR